VCTIALAVDALADAPLAVAATREEAADRPSEPPAIRWQDAGTTVLAPLDARAGGTWIGVNEHAICVAVANRWSDAAVAGERSRGRLVRDALGGATVDGALDTVAEALEADRYAPFRLVVGSGATGRTVIRSWPGGRAPQTTMEDRSLDPGVHVVTNVGVDDTVELPTGRPGAGERQVAVAARVRDALDPDRLSADTPVADAWLDRAATVLADHEIGACVHGEYGTRSASVLAMDEEGALDYRYADGRPCETPFQTVWSDRPVAVDSESEG
jgi:uncharacterized protein with NRDE domain